MRTHMHLSLVSLLCLSRIFFTSLSLHLLTLNFYVMLSGQAMSIVSSSLEETFDLKITDIFFFLRSVFYQLLEDPIFLQWA